MPLSSFNYSITSNVISSVYFYFYFFLFFFFPFYPRTLRTGEHKFWKCRSELTRNSVPTKTCLQESSLVEMTDIIPYFYDPFIAIKQVKYADWCIRNLPWWSSIWWSPLIEWSDHTSVSNHDHPLPWRNKSMQHFFLQYHKLSM